jgi:hypothetical protein
MTTGTIKTKGTRLYFTNAAGSPQDILKVACATGITGLGGAADQIDKTCLDSEEREFEQGFKTPSVVTIPINFIPRSASHQALEELFDSGDTVSWMIVASDQAGAPTTLDADNRLVSPGATTREFLGYVSDFTFDVSTNDIWRGTLTVQRSGKIARVNPTADLP